MSATEEFLKANEDYAETFTKGALPLPPGRKVAVVVCMDARIDPARALGLEEGDAHVIRNAGGRIADAVAFLPFKDLDQSVRDDIAAYKTSPLVRQDVPVRGFVYDVRTGRLREVV